MPDHRQGEEGVSWAIQKLIPRFEAANLAFAQMQAKACNAAVADAICRSMI